MTSIKAIRLATVNNKSVRIISPN